MPHPPHFTHHKALPIRLRLPPPPQILTIFDLPRPVRDHIYHEVLHGDAPQTTRWDGRTEPHRAVDSLGLLRASRRVHQEASAVLHATVHLGSDAVLAKAYLDFSGAQRVQQIRHLTIFYECDRICLRHGYPGDELCVDWMPVFDLLRETAGGLEKVVVHCAPCNGCYLTGGGPSKRYLNKRCRLEWDAEMDRFWCGLKTLTTPQEIRFEGKGAPEYFVHGYFERMGWEIDGVVENGRSSEQLGDMEWVHEQVVPFTTFHGRVVNPHYLGKPTKVSEDSENLPRSEGRMAGEDKVREGRGFWSLPSEIREMVYDDASEWVYKPFWPALPARYNTGAAMLRVSKQMRRDALPSIYRTFRIYGGAPLTTLDKLGANLAFVRKLEIHFSCFCAWGGSDHQLNNGTIYATEDPEATNEWCRGTVLSDWYPRESVVKRYHDEWDQVSRRVQAQGCFPELAVTYLSCNRSEFLEDTWVPPGRFFPTELSGYKSRCSGLESKFNNFLERCADVHKISLAGNVPPSMAVRLARPRLLPSQSLAPPRSLVQISPAMRKYLKISEARFRKWEKLGQSDTFWNRTWFPFLQYNSVWGATPHFVLSRTVQARIRWREGVAEKNEAELGEEGDAAVALILSRKPWELQEVMDRGTVMLTDEDWA